MAFFANKSGANLPAGRHVIDVGDDAINHQLSLSGSGTVTISVYVPGEVDRDGDEESPVVGEMTVDDPVVDLSVAQAPRLFVGFIDAFVLTGTEPFSYRIQSGK